jgi:hypothetical protein
MVLMGLVAISVAAEPVSAITIDLTSGTTGTTFFNQSFNETRGVDVTVLGSSDLLLTSMTLDEFNISIGSATVGARVYQSSTGLLLDSSDVAVGSGNDQSATLPISTLLLVGQTYRVAFFITNQGSGDGFDASPAGLSITPYVDDTGSLRITQAFAIGADAFPTNLNAFVPFISLEARPVSAPEPATWMLQALAGLWLTVLRRRRTTRR